MLVTILGKTGIITTIGKSHVTRHDIPEATTAMAIAKTQAIEIILERSHTLFFIQLGKRKVFTDGIGTCVPVEFDFTPLQLVKETGNRIFLSKQIGKIHNLKGRSKLETVRLRNRPVILLNIRRILETEVIRNGLLLVKVRRELHIERNERNQLGIKGQPELLIS